MCCGKARIFVQPSFMVLLKRCFQFLESGQVQRHIPSPLYIEAISIRLCISLLHIFQWEPLDIVRACNCLKYHVQVFYRWMFMDIFYMIEQKAIKVNSLWYQISKKILQCSKILWQILMFALNHISEKYTCPHTLSTTCIAYEGNTFYFLSNRQLKGQESFILEPKQAEHPVFLSSRSAAFSVFSVNENLIKCTMLLPPWLIFAISPRTVPICRPLLCWHPSEASQLTAT